MIQFVSRMVVSRRGHGDRHLAPHAPRQRSGLGLLIFDRRTATTQTERPSPTPGVALLSVGGPARTSVAGHIHEVLAPASLGLLRGTVRRSRLRPLALRLASSPPFRTFPLLI